MSPPISPDNITKLLERVRLSVEKSHFPEQQVLVLAVSKTQPPEAIRAAHAQGLNHFGENYVQEALDKMAVLHDLPLTWHFIGPIQSNKTRPIAEHFQWVHSLEREKVARRLNDQRPEDQSPLQVCIQVNISGEASKSGIEPAQLQNLARTIDALPRLRLRGLMAVPAATGDRAEQHRAFAAMRALFERLRTEFPEVDTLSMGMSSDLEAAIAEGATLVRVGTAIFGPRDYGGA